MKTREKQRRGISLIVLIIIIIVMIILAGAIILTLNNSGVIGRANEAIEKTNQATIKEAVNIAYGDWVLAKQMNNETKSADKYVKEKLKEQGFSDEDLELIAVTDDGKIAINTKHVEGNKKVIIPDGFIVSDVEGENTIAGGLVIYEGTEKVSTDADAKTTRNQFVWIPVDNFSEFVRRSGYKDGGVQNISSYEEPSTQLFKGSNLSEENDITGEYAEYKAMKASVEKYGGFYIARYEAGDGNATSPRSEYVESLNVVSKADSFVYNYIPWFDETTELTSAKGAVIVSRNMYANSISVASHLVYGVEWDAMMRWMEDVLNPDQSNVPFISNSQGMGYYWDNASQNPNRKTGIPYVNSVYPNIVAMNKVKNVFDVAGNVYEWSMEGLSTNIIRLVRGGHFDNDGASNTASTRSEQILRNTKDYIGFRVALYLK